MSTTTEQKKLIDFLWEWSENHGVWGEMLIEKVVSTEDYLTEADRKTIFSYFLQSLNLFTGLPELSFSKPDYQPGGHTIALNSLSSVTGVNRLSSDQSVPFSKNITVIYGENGTGKTGYSRILKALGFSYDPSPKVVYSNVFTDPEAKSAHIDYTVDGNPKTFTWDGENKNSDLESISVFNSNCVQYSLIDRGLIVSPLGFHLFTLVSAELQNLESLLKAEIKKYPTDIVWLDNLHDSSKQKNFLLALSNKSSEDELEQLSSYSEGDKENLQNLKTEYSKLNNAILQKEIRDTRAELTELETLLAKVSTTSRSFSGREWEELLSYNTEIDKLSAQSQKGLTEIAKERGVTLYESDEFKQFIESADSYIKLLGKSEYPNPSDVCVYCQQPLEEGAQDLLKNYRLLLEDTTETEIRELKGLKEKLIQKVSQLQIELKLHLPSFGVDEQEHPVQPNEFSDYNTELNQLKEIFTSDKVEEGSSFTFTYAPISKLLIKRTRELSTILTAKEDTLTNLSEEQSKLLKKIEELEDRAKLNAKKEEVSKAIENHKVVWLLNKNFSQFNTSSLSRKASEAREALVSQNFNSIFKDELSALRKSNAGIELSFGTERGKPKVFQKISRHSLLEILSEGEQKAIALAEFLTELQLDNVSAPVIFDDPVNSLDHRIIDKVAKRLILLSQERQVIIFTHSILLLNNLIQQSELPVNKGVEFSFHTVKSNYGKTGILKEGGEAINSYNYYKTKLDILLREQSGDEEDRARKGYGHLRSAIEVAVEDTILQKSIRRYSKGVSFPALMRVDGQNLDTHKRDLNDIYEKCCTSIDGHSSPEQEKVTPTLEELELDYEKFQAIKSSFK